MASQAQIEANRANALKSTGPRTSEGKAVVAQNAVKHGLLAEQVVIAGEDPGEFEFYRRAMIGELSPVGQVEGMLAERAVGLAWRLRRAERIAAEVFGTLLAKVASAEHMKKMTRAALPKAIREEMEQADEGQTELGQAVVRDYANYRVLDRLGLYERRIEKSFFAVMKELERLRVIREVGPGETETSKNHNRQERLQKTYRVGCASHTVCEDEPIESVCDAHPTATAQFQTNPGDQNSSDTNEIAPAGGGVETQGLGNGECGFGHRHAVPTPNTATERIQTKPIDAPGVVRRAGING